MTSTFNFFRLPYLAIIEVFKTMEVAEIVQLSLTSKKTWSCLQRFLTHRGAGPFMIAIILPECFTLAFRPINQLAPKPTDNVRDRIVHIHAKDLHNTAELFKNPMVVWKINKIVPEIRQMIAVGQSLNLETFEVNVKQEEATVEMFDDVMRLSAGAKKATINWKTPDNFTFDVSAYQPFHLDVFKIFAATWVTVDIIAELFMNCKSLSLSGNLWGQADISMFIKKWIEHSEIRSALIECVMRSFADAVVGIDSEPVLSIFEKGARYNFPEGMCYKIKKNNGQEAIVLHRRGRFVLTTDFQL